MKYFSALLITLGILTPALSWAAITYNGEPQLNTTIDNDFSVNVDWQSADIEPNGIDDDTGCPVGETVTVYINCVSDGSCNLGEGAFYSDNSVAISADTGAFAFTSIPDGTYSTIGFRCEDTSQANMILDAGIDLWTVATPAAPATALFTAPSAVNFFSSTSPYSAEAFSSFFPITYPVMGLAIGALLVLVVLGAVLSGSHKVLGSPRRTPPAGRYYYKNGKYSRKPF